MSHWRGTALCEGGRQALAHMVMGNAKDALSEAVVVRRGAVEEAKIELFCEIMQAAPDAIALGSVESVIVLACVVLHHL